MAPKRPEHPGKSSGSLRKALPKVLKKQTALERSIEALKCELEGLAPTTTQFESVLREVQSNIRSARAILSECLHPTLPAFMPTTSSTHAAIKVFGTAELAEMIFSHLLPMDLLRVQQVNTTMRDLVQSSKKLQRRMFLVSDKTAHFEVLTLDPDVTFKIHTLAPTTEVEHRISVHLDTKKRLPRLGSRSLQMQLCQPRLKKMLFEFSCCRYNSPARRAPFNSLQTIENPNGITLGNLYEVLKEAIDTHRLCPFATYLSDHDENGFLWPEVTLAGSVQLNVGDPLRRRKLEQKSYREKVREVKRKQENRIHAYVMAKRAAFENNMPIPTLAEYEASLQTAENEGGDEDG